MDDEIVQTIEIKVFDQETMNTILEALIELEENGEIERYAVRVI